MTTTMPVHPVRRHGLVGPLILIGMGVLFLLNNFGILSWNVWSTLFQFWPVVLIAVGLDILVGQHSTAGSLVVVLLLFVALGLGLWWLGPRSAVGTTLASQTITQPLQGATRGEVDLSLGVGTLELGAMQEPDGLIAGTIETPQLDRLVRETGMRGDTALFSLRYRENTTFGNRWGEQDTWHLHLNPEIPMTLHLDTGVGTARLDLSNLQISSFDINTGVGKTTVQLPRQGNVAGKIEGGVGQVILNIPKDRAVRIELNRGLGSVTMPTGYIQEGNIYTSPGYAATTNRIDLHVNGGVGSIQLMIQ